MVVGGLWVMGNREGTTYSNDIVNEILDGGLGGCVDWDRGCGEAELGYLEGDGGDG